MLAVMEEWRRIECKPGLRTYWVSNKGRTKSVKANGTERILKQWTFCGYPGVSLPGHNVVHVHPLVLAAFKGPRPKGYICHHIDNCKTNNRLENLEWIPEKLNRSESTRVRHLLGVIEQQRFEIERLKSELEQSR